jgi:3',5'-cyclic-AMP phosphodiesterase
MAGATSHGQCLVRARIFGARGKTVTCQIDDDPEVVMKPSAEAHQIWSCPVFPLDDGLHRIMVRACDPSGVAGEDAITVLVARSGAYDPPARTADGSDADSVGAWLEKGILGTQLGPNKNGRKW